MTVWGAPVWHNPPMTDTAQEASAAADKESGKPADADGTSATDQDQRPKEIGGRTGPDPTRFGDWEKNGRCIDF